MWRGFSTDLFDEIRSSFRSMQRDMEELFRRAGLPSTTIGTERQLTSGTEMEHGNLPFWRGYPPVDAWVENNNLHVQAEIPGVDPKDVEVFVQGNELILRGKRVHETETKDRNWLFREIGQGWFERRFALPEGVDADNVQASYRNGLLHVTVPASAALLPRQVTVKVEDAHEKSTQRAA